MTAPTGIEKQLAWEARQRPRAGIAAAAGVVGLIVFLVLQESVGSGAPSPSYLQSLQRAVQPGPLDKLTSLQVPVFQYVQDHSAEVLLSGIAGLIGYAGLGWTVGFLAVATRARRPELPRWAVILGIGGGVVVGLGVLVLQIAALTKASDFLSGPRTVAEAPTTGALVTFGKLLQIFGNLTLAVGIVIVSLNAMRAGLLTKLFGVLGIITGGLLVIYPLPIVQIFWLGSISMLCLNWWPGGIPPAWRTGRAEPWPSTRPQPAAKPAPAGPQPRSSARGKRKKRSQ